MPIVGKTTATPKDMSPRVMLMSIPISNPMVMDLSSSERLLHAGLFSFNAVIFC